MKTNTNAGALSAWTPVPPADLSQFKPSDFTDEELDLPYYLAHFHRILNGVVESGPNRGFIGISVWRPENVNKPFNARIMENLLSMTYFYCTDRPWNLYHGSSAVRQRLEAAFEFWIKIQNPDGRFSEYAPGNWNLAATAFATKFVGESLRLLKDGPPLDPDLHKRIIAADHKAIMATLTQPALYEWGKHYENQYGNVWGGALAYLALFPDPEVEQQMKTRLAQSRADFHSPVGYPYEEDGPDWSYNFNTHHHNTQMAWQYLRGKELGRQFVDEERNFAEWLVYNAAIEPSGSGFTLNRGVETRQKQPYLDRLDTPLAEVIEASRAFATSREELAAERKTTRAQIAAHWPQVKPLQVGDFWAYSPYVFLHRAHPYWYPSERERQVAIAALPYNARTRFVHQRADSRKAIIYTFVRHLPYYAAFNTGELVRPQQRLGLGLLWHPTAGAFLQSQTDSDTAAWGTHADGAKSVYEAASLPAIFSISDRALPPSAPGNHDLPLGDLMARYPLGREGFKTVRFTEAAIGVAVTHRGGFREEIPLLVQKSDQLQVEPNRITLTRRGIILEIGCEDALRIERADTQETVGTARVVVLRVSARDRLTYQIRIR